MRRRGFLAAAAWLLSTIPLVASDLHHVDITSTDCDDEAYLQIADPSFPDDCQRFRWYITNPKYRQPDGDPNGVMVDRTDVGDSVDAISTLEAVFGDVRAAQKADQRNVFAYEVWEVQIDEPVLAPGLTGIYAPYYLLRVTPTDLGSQTIREAWTCKDDQGNTLASDNWEGSEIGYKADSDNAILADCRAAIFASVTVADLPASEFCFDVPAPVSVETGTAGPYTFCFTPSDNGGNTDFSWTLTNGAGTSVDSDTASYADATKAREAIEDFVGLGRAGVSATLVASSFPPSYSIPCAVSDFGSALLTVDGPYQIVGTSADNGPNTDFSYHVEDGAGNTIGSTPTPSYADGTEIADIRQAMRTHCRTTLKAVYAATDVATASLDLKSPELPFIPVNAPISVSACGTALDTNYRTYQLTQNITTADTNCFNVDSVLNIGIDLNGFTISVTGSGKAFGVPSGSVNNFVTIRNGTITSDLSTDILIGKNAGSGSARLWWIHNITCTMDAAAEQDNQTDTNCFGYENGVDYLRFDNNIANMIGQTGGSFAYLNFNSFADAAELYGLFNELNNTEAAVTGRNGQMYYILGYDAITSTGHGEFIGEECNMGAGSQANCYLLFSADNINIHDTQFNLSGSDRIRGVIFDSGSQCNTVSYGTFDFTGIGGSSDGIRWRANISGGCVNTAHHNTMTGWTQTSGHGAIYITRNTGVVRHNTVTGTLSGSTGVVTIEGCESGSVTSGYVFVGNTITDSGSGYAIWIRGLTCGITDVIFQGDTITGTVRIEATGVTTVDEVYFCNTDPTTPTLEGQVSEGTGTLSYTIQAEDCYP